MKTVSAGIGCGRVIVQVSGASAAGIVGAGLAVAVAGGGVAPGDADGDTSLPGDGGPSPEQATPSSE